MTIKTRLNQITKQLEKLYKPKPVIRVYFHDAEKGYSAAPRIDGPYYPTEAILFAAMGWQDNPQALHINVGYSQPIDFENGDLHN